MATAIWLQKDMRSPSGGKARHRGGTHIGKAPPSPEMSISSLTKGQVFGEDQIARFDLSPALPDVAARPSGGLFRFRLDVSSESQITLRHRAFGTVAIAPSSTPSKSIAQLAVFATAAADRASAA